MVSMKKLPDILFLNRYLGVLLLIFSSNAVASRYDPNESFSILDLLILPVSGILLYWFVCGIDFLDGLINKWLEAYKKDSSETIFLTLGVFGILFIIYAVIKTNFKNG
jgi:hypothetical protein